MHDQIHPHFNESSSKFENGFRDGFIEQRWQ